MASVPAPSTSLRVVQEQNNGVELLPGSIVGTQRDDEVVEAVPRCLRRHDDQLVLKAVGLGILEAAVRAALRQGNDGRQVSVDTPRKRAIRKKKGFGFFLLTPWIHLIEAKAAEGSLLWQEVAESGRAADVGRVGWVALYKTVGRKQSGCKSKRQK